MIRGIYDSDNEQALLKFNGPYRNSTPEPLFIVIRPQVVQTTKVVKLGNVKIYGTPHKANNVKEEEAQ
jgi:hypothetical protein